jgi:SpoIID/LytB domain protein
MLAAASFFFLSSLGFGAGLPPEAEIRSRLGRLFERQAYAELVAAVLEPADDWQRLIKARALADLGRWQDCLDSLGALNDRRSRRLKAEAVDMLGSTQTATAWTHALRDGGRNPEAALVAFKAGLSAYQRGDWAACEDLLKHAEKLDASYSAVNAFLATLYFEEGRLSDARVRLERALRVDPDDLELRSCLNLLYQADPRLLKEVASANTKKEARSLAKPNPRVAPILLLEGEPLIRVGLLVHAPSFKFKTGGPTCLQPLGILLPEHAAYEVKAAPQGMTLRRLDGQASQVLVLGESSFLEGMDSASTLSLFEIGYGAGYFWAGSEDRSYRGAMEFKRDSQQGVTVINSLPLEAYLCSVLPAEMPAEWPMPALKAQAIAARSETLAKLGRFSKDGYDVCPDILCAVYKGTQSETPRSNRAVIETSGRVLEGPRGRALDAVYMDNSGGHTQEPWQAWSGPAGQVQAVFDGPASSPWATRFPLNPADLIDYLDDPQDDIASYGAQASGQPYSSWRWVARYSAHELSACVNRRHDVGHLLAVEPLDRNAWGFVESVRFVGSRGESRASSDRIRSSIKGLRSNLFYVETRRDSEGLPLEFLFHGGGWGHGVGLSQSGAYGMAKSGYPFKEILGHYFEHATLTRRY